MPLDEVSIKKIMKQADIQGVSAASVSQGDITDISFGTNECGLYKVDMIPSQESLSRLDGSRYFLTTNPQGLYYFDSLKKPAALEDLNITKEQHQTLYKFLQKNKEYTERNSVSVLSKMMLEKITKITSHEHKVIRIEPQTQFRAASLSKPLFSYLVLKLIEEDVVTKKALGLENFNLNTPLYEILPGFEKDNEDAKKITVGMILSHCSGILLSQDAGSPKIRLEPDTEFSYAGWPLFYLQMALEKQTARSLQSLAQEFVFTPCKMNNSDFLMPGKEDKAWQPHNDDLFPIDPSQFSSISALSLRTTAVDYAKFMQSWMKDEKLKKYLLTPKVSMTKDRWAQDIGVKPEVLEDISWGYGVGQQQNNGEVNAVFHYGDMTQWRSFVAINPKDETGIVFFANSPNGLVLAHEMTKEIINADKALEFVEDKFGFATSFEDKWKKRQDQRETNIKSYLNAQNKLMASQEQLKLAEEKLTQLLPSTPAYSAAQQDLKLATKNFNQAQHILQNLLDKVKSSQNQSPEELDEKQVLIKTKSSSSNRDTSEMMNRQSSNQSQTKEYKLAIEDIKNKDSSDSPKSTYVSPNPFNKTPKPQ